MTIKEISQEFDLTKDTIRYWEKEKLIPPVKRDENGYRVYDQYEENWIFYIKVLRKAGMQVKRIKYFVNLYRDGSSSDRRKRLLIEQRGQLKKQMTKIQKTINYLNYKIDHFDDHLLTFEKNWYMKGQPKFNSVQRSS